jgi:hypothetical protein
MFFFWGGGEFFIFLRTVCKIVVQPDRELDVLYPAGWPGGVGGEDAAVAPVVVQVGVGGEDGAVLQEQVHHILYLAVVHLPAHNEGVLLLEGAAARLPAVQGVPANIATSNLREKIIVLLHYRTYILLYITM